MPSIIQTEIKPVGPPEHYWTKENIFKSVTVCCNNSKIKSTQVTLTTVLFSSVGPLSFCSYNSETAGNNLILHTCQVSELNCISSKNVPTDKQRGRTACLE